MAKLKELYLNDLISLDEYKADHAVLSAKLEDLTARDEPVKMPNYTEIEKIMAGDWRKDYDAVGREAKRDFWRIIIKKIPVCPDRKIEFDLNV